MSNKLTTNATEASVAPGALSTSAPDALDSIRAPKVDADADADADADGEADADAMDVEEAGSAMDQGELLDLIQDVASFLCEYKEPGEDETLAIGFQRLPNRRLLPSYFEVISTPMAFSTIRGKVTKKQYTKFSEFVRDVAQITHNAQVFNRPSAGIFGAAVRLQALFKSKLQKLVARGTITEADATLPDLGDLPSADESSDGEEEEEEEDDDDEEEDEEELEEKAARQRSRKRGEPKRRGRPPRVLTPTEARIVAIIRGIRESTNAQGESIIGPFMELPDREANPGYYEVITQPISVNQIQRKSDRKKYRAVDDVIRDFRTMFTNATTYNEDGSEIHNMAIQLLERLTILAKEQLTKPDNSFRDVSGRLPLTQTVYNGITWRIGDWVHLVNPNKDAKPIPAQIFRMWTDNTGQTWINACWYFRPEQTVHRSDRQFYNNEVFKTNQYHDHRIEDVIDACFVMFVGLYCQGRPRGLPPNKMIYVCESRYNEEKLNFKKIKAWASCMPDEVRDAEYALDQYPVPRQMVKIPSPILDLLPPNAKDDDPVPLPKMGNLQAPPLVGAVYKRSSGPNDFPPPGSTPTTHSVPPNHQQTASPALYASQQHPQPHGYHPSPVLPMASPSPGPGQPYMMPPGQAPMPYHPHQMPMQHPHQPSPSHIQGHFVPPLGGIPPQIQQIPRQSPVPVPVPPSPYQGMMGPQPVRGMHPQGQSGFVSHMQPHPHHQQFVPSPQQFMPQPMPPQQAPPPQPMPVPVPQPAHYSMPPRPMATPQATTGPATMSIPPNTTGPRVEVFTLDEEANSKIPKEISDQFQKDENGKILFFSAPPLARPHTGLSRQAATMSHSVKYLAGREEWLVEREKKRKERDEAAKQSQLAEKQKLEAEQKQAHEKMIELVADGVGQWCKAHLETTEKMFEQTQAKRIKQLGLIVALLAALPTAAVPTVDISVQAAFPSPPYLLELIETAAGENATAYYPILDKVAAGHFNGISTDQELYEAFLNLLTDDGHITRPDVLSTFKFALSMRTAAPRVEAHYQYYATGVEPKLTDSKPGQDSTCEAWVLLNGKQYCQPRFNSTEARPAEGLDANPLPFDRVYGTGKPAVLYADVTSPSFAPMHKALMDAARKGEVSYKLRHCRSKHSADQDPLLVSGYGVELALKRTDYIVIDDRDTGDAPSDESSTQVLLDSDEDVADLKPLTTSEVRHIGLKAMSYIMQSENPLETLIKVSQDFPKYSTKIAAHNISEEILDERKRNDGNVPTGYNIIWINGVQQIERQVDPYTLLETLRRERKLIEGVRALGLDAQQVNDLIGHKAITMSKLSDDGVRYDWRDTKYEEGKVIMWMNDLENDKRYAQFESSVKALLKPTYGQMPNVRRNLQHLIVPIDFTNPDDISLATQLWGFAQRGLSLRFGIVPLLPSETAFEVSKVLYYLYQQFGFHTMITYVTEAGMNGLTGPIESAYLAATSKPKVASEKDDSGDEVTDIPEALPLTEVLNSKLSTAHIDLARHWITRLDATTKLVFVNGLLLPRTPNWMQYMSQRLNFDLQMLQQAVYLEKLTDEMDPLEFFLKEAIPRVNKYITPPDEKDPRMLNINKIYTDHKALLDKVAAIEPTENTPKENWAAVSLVADLTSDVGLQLLQSAFAFAEANVGIRLDIIPNPVKTSGASLVNDALIKGDPDVETIEQLRQVLIPEGHVADEAFDIALEAYLRDTNIQPGTNVIILNGRIIGPIVPEHTFSVEDFQQFLENERRLRIFPVYAAIDDLQLGDVVSTPLDVAKLTSITALSAISDLPQGIFERTSNIRLAMYNDWDRNHTSFEIGNPKDSNVHIQVLLDPISEQGQKWGGILKVLSELDGVYIKIYLNADGNLSELPVKRFWYTVLNSKPTFDNKGKVQGLHALFKGLPSEALLNVKLDVPPLWLVAPKVSIYDLDNIKLSSAKGDVEAIYELQSILIEGHSREGPSAAPRGAQLVLATENDPHVEDTIVMANIGYFQFKANPGYFNIQLLPGRSSEIFEITSAGSHGYREVPGDEGTHICVMSFQGTTLYPRLKRKPGMAKVDVLGPEETEDSLIAKGKKLAADLGNLFGGKADTSMSASDKEHAEINIFSVASGHLYERMLNIMMVSVMKNTKHTVKFWFIEQFLSPSFKDFIPYLAEAYGFKYEMVNYKWPHWLRGQKEKQREIWGYKILFLDVLFPLSLDKVIFVDADQVVRTDMIDLVNLDLEGAPYGFTPMCDSRTEMEGFRFWKQGYWANFLRGHPYHISALYVVDLKQFRKIAAGDRLRQQYHALSADPNSLSNLDQDLPNNMQFQIKIYSLPQEWLWCETWCSDESLKEARTIDLCNNPQTKEPKLDRARRQVPEWTKYDDEIALIDKKRRKSESKIVTESKTLPVQKNTKSRVWEEPSVSVYSEKDEL